MGLSSEMKNLSEEILASFKQRIIDNEELVNEVQKTLDGFRKDHQEMSDILNANAASLRKSLVLGEKERINTFNELMSGIHSSIISIQNEVVEIQASTFNMINEFSQERASMAEDLKVFFTEGSAQRKKDEKLRIKEFDAMMKEINLDIKSINNEVLAIFSDTNEMLDKFGKEHLNMSAELRKELSKNLIERVEYTRNLLNGFQKRLSEITIENQKMAQKLRKDLNKGEVDRLSQYNSLMKGIHSEIKAIRNDVMTIQKHTSNMVHGFSTDRQGATDAWNNMQEAIAQIRKSGTVKPVKVTEKKVEKEEISTETPKSTPVAAIDQSTTVQETIKAPEKQEPLTLEQKMLAYLANHPNGAKISEMEGSLGETRMKLGFTAKGLLDEGKVQKIDNIYFPIK